MKSYWKRVSAAVLAVCLMLPLTPTARAAGTAAETLTAAAKAAGFDYCYEETYREISAEKAGAAASVSIPAPDHVIAGRGVYAAVLPLDGADRSVYFSAVTVGSSYTVRCAREGCTAFAVMLVQPVLDGGNISLSVAVVENADSYTVTYVANLNMSDALAEIAVVNKTNPAMDSLRFTCYLTDPLINGRESVTVNHISVESSVFALDSTAKSEGGWSAAFRLISGWNEGSASQVKARLKEPMTITVTEQVSYEELESRLIDQTLYTCGQLLITRAGGEAIPGLGTQTQITLPTNLAEVKLSASGPMAHAVAVTAETGGTASADYTQAAAGTRVTVTAAPDSGYRFNDLKITDADGNSVAYVDNGDGTYSFIMPSAAVQVTVSFRRAIAAPEDTGVALSLQAEDHIVYMIGDDFGNFRPGANITRAEVAMIFYRLLLDQNVETTVRFSDVTSGIWYEDAVNTLASIGIVKGVGDGRFAPEREITRAEFAVIAARFAQQVPDAEVSFADVPAGYWAYDEIMTAAGFGWVVGGDYGNFWPGNYISREEVAAIVNRMLGRLSDKAAVDSGWARVFPDVSSSGWAYYDIAEATTAHDHVMNADRTKETWK